MIFSRLLCQLILRTIHSRIIDYKSLKNTNLKNNSELNEKSSKSFNNVKKIKDAIEYCLKKTKEHDYENYISILFMPKNCQLSFISVIFFYIFQKFQLCTYKQKKFFLKILALNVEIASVRQKIKRNSGVTGIYQLQFWHDALLIWASRKNGLLPRFFVFL